MFFDFCDINIQFCLLQIRDFEGFNVYAQTRKERFGVNRTTKKLRIQLQNLSNQLER